MKAPFLGQLNQLSDQWNAYPDYVFIGYRDGTCLLQESSRMSGWIHVYDFNLSVYFRKACGCGLIAELSPAGMSLRGNILAV